MEKTLPRCEHNFVREQTDDDDDKHDASSVAEREHEFKTSFTSTLFGSRDVNCGFRQFGQFLISLSFFLKSRLEQFCAFLISQ
jgi:hypothetical protein